MVCYKYSEFSAPLIVMNQSSKATYMVFLALFLVLRTKVICYKHSYAIVLSWWSSHSCMFESVSHLIHLKYIAMFKYNALNWRPQNLTKDKKIQLTRKILTYTEIIGVVNVRYLTNYKYVLQNLQIKFLVSYLPRNVSYFSYLKMLDIVGLHKTVRYWNVIYMIDL